MAIKEVTLRRYNGTGTDTLMPTTTMAQVQVSTSDTTSITDFLINNYINLTQKGAVNGVATLDSAGKVPFNQIPDAFIGGLKFRGSISANKDLDDYLFSFPVEAEAIGSYYIATADITISSTSGSVTIKAPGDEGDFDLTDGINLESGDWLIVTGWIPGTSLEFVIINNTYSLATDLAKGLVTLSSATDTTGTTSKVITESILGGLIGTAANTIAAGDHLHDDRYYTETEIGHYFDGTTAITGYNKANWDTAYGWGDHSVEGYLTEESLADLTDTTLTSLAANDILRYNGTAWVNDGNFKPILYGTGQTSSITGAIIIETD